MTEASHQTTLKPLPPWQSEASGHPGWLTSIIVTYIFVSLIVLVVTFEWDIIDLIGRDSFIIIFPHLIDRFYGNIISLQPFFTAFLITATWWIAVSLWQHFAPRSTSFLFRNFTSRAWDHQTAALETRARLIQELVDYQLNLSPKQFATYTKIWLLQEMRDRVARIRARTALILFTIGLALVAATLIVIYAGRLTGIDATAVSNVDKLESEISDLDQRLADVTALNDLYSGKVPTDDTTREANQSTSIVTPNSRENAAKSNPPAANDTGKSKPNRFERLRSDPTMPQTLGASEAMISNQRSRLKEETTLLDVAWTKQIDDQSASSYRYMISTAITRIGVVLIIVFLVQILIGLYRYNTRLITFYNSRRDFLYLWDGDANLTYS